MKLLKMISVLFTLSILMTACNTNSNEDTQNDSERSIATSIYPIEYLVTEIAGDYVDVETIVPSGADAHSYEPSTKTMIELSSSDGFFFIGESMESFSEAMADTVQKENVELLKLAEHEPLFEDFHQGEAIEINSEDNEEHNDESEEHHDHEHEHDDAEHNHNEEHAHDESEGHHSHNHDVDPHFWLDPLRMVDAGEIVLDKLVSMYPEEEETFKQNFETFKSKMEELDEQYQESFDEEVSILVTHKSFSYIEQRYPVKQFSIRGISSAQEPSQRELQLLFDQIEELHIEHIILETSSDDRLAQTIADELGLEKYHLSNLSTRTEEEINEEKDYYDIMIDNLNVLNEINH
ncbi:metal ABC transporter solute-binding protein, Zn/Mn family [Piscibacillus halophilus]|uniref:Zinc transport system substrate-binding protein n=2 Tax=Piscibacillus halophilus TaxID=571933 RepID=A0A1H9ETN2_9BACI|nr:zinc ABC transporter substrate-binding protein [Piscibacillus halophilus]SEQ28348.1 zinc transport system substrate-binding protein [Piscibacillus halophilus]